jgi:dihydropteroate synthase
MLKPLLIVNLTPDSFSDGGKFHSPSIVDEFIKRNSKKDYNFFDFGAESTAPFNQPISAAEEIERLAPFIDLINENQINVSLDTYHLETVKWFKAKVNKTFLWNDVSGVLDEETLHFLKDHENIHYVLSHTLVPSKDQTSFHMDYLCDGSIKDEVVNKWSHCISIFKENSISLERIYFDPCFGFSKTHDQNMELIKSLSDIEKALPLKRWLLGISKKSFLKNTMISFGVEKEQARDKSEFLHFSIIKHWNKVLRKPILLRLHDPFMFDALRWELSELNS